MITIIKTINEIEIILSYFMSKIKNQIVIIL